MNIMLFKFSSGETVVANVDASESDFQYGSVTRPLRVHKPLGVAIIPSQTGGLTVSLIPWVPSDYMIVHPDFLLALSDAPKDLADLYIRATTGIITASNVTPINKGSH